jgi:lipopolysaccharide/colanic/teichoic acid biosynthesis glycosyltransferase
VRVEDPETIFERLTGKILLDDLKPSWLIFSDGFRARRVTRTLKRTLDLTLALAALLLAWPLMLLTALAVRLESTGPVLYVQERVGEHGRIFTLYKFRSMRADAEKHTGAVLAEKDDPRITRVGRFLRKTRLDELPQLWDVLCGRMSIVGPRPERPELLSNLAFAIPFFEERMRDVKPGITGLAQISLGYTGEVPKNSAIAELVSTLQNPYGLEETAGSVADDMRIKLLYDLAYLAALEHYGAFLAMELKILVRTPLVMILGRGQ